MKPVIAWGVGEDGRIDAYTIMPAENHAKSVSEDISEGKLFLEYSPPNETINDTRCVAMGKEMTRKKG